MVTESMRRVFLALTFLSCVSLLGSAVYYTSIITPGTLVLATLGALLVTAGMDHFFVIPDQVRHDEKQKNKMTDTVIRHYVLFLIGLSSLIIFVFLAITHPITTATRSLWLLFSPTHIVFLTIAFFCTILLYKKQEGGYVDPPLHDRPPRYAAILGGLIAFVTSALAAILFPLGFGFDPFLHRATLEHIATFGTITPKPLYYIGAYALELCGNLLLRIPLFSLDVFLAPVGFAFLVFIAVRSKQLHPAILALLPFSAFVSTTPQAIGFLWIFAVILALKNNLPQLYLWLFALAALAAHPIAGVPAVILVTIYCLLNTKRNKTNHDKVADTVIGHYGSILTTIFIILGILALPLMFFAQQLITGMNVGFSWVAFTDFSRIPSLGFFSMQGHALMDTVMLFGGNVFFITVILAIIGFIVTLGQRKINARSFAQSLALLLASIVALGNFVMLSLGFDFPFLISYERTDFALRLVTIAWIFLLPLASDGMKRIIGIVTEWKLRKSETRYLESHRDELRTYGRVLNPPLHTRLKNAYGILLILILFSANIYTTFPRHDGYTRSAAFNVTVADTEIVHRIADDAAGESYAVLSNQTLASMAIQEFGFFQYFHNNIFAYPIPTSGPLYTLFLTMITTPNLETIAQAHDLTGASRIYFVVHNYWWEADLRIAETKKIADAYFTSADGTITVFVFSR